MEYATVSLEAFEAVVGCGKGGCLRVKGLKGGERREKKREVDWTAESTGNLDVLPSQVTAHEAIRRGKVVVAGPKLRVER